jgi:predicted secreted Zn-dependent protease
MAKGRALNRKRRKRRRRRSPDEERSPLRSVNPGARLSGLALLQQQVGNRVVQQMLARSTGSGQAQRQAEEDEKAAKALVEVGEIEIEKPEIEYYEVTGNSLAEVSGQILPPGQWYEYEYRYVPKVENGVVTQVDVTVDITLRLPQWTGPGWDQAPDADKFEWLQLLQALEIDQEEEYEDVTELPQKWLLGPKWEKAPESLKKEWQAMLQALQSQEKGALDIARRRAMVLQQRLFKQSEKQVKAIFDQFMKDLKIEQEAYIRQMEFGQEQKVSLGAKVMVQ